MKKPPHTEKRGGQWWYRRRVPTELVALIGRVEYRESLRTADVEQARTKAAVKDAVVAIEFQAARESLRPTAMAPVLPEALTPEQKRYIVNAVRAHILDEDETQRLQTVDPDSMEAYELVRGEQFDEAMEALRSGHVAVRRRQKERVTELLARIGLSVTPTSPAWNVAGFKATEGLNQALIDISQRMRGNFIPTPDLPAVPGSLRLHTRELDSQVAPNTSLGEVIDHYLLGLPETGFKRKVRRCLQLLGEMLGRNMKVSDLRQKAVTQFLRDICRLPDKWARRFDAGESLASMLAEGAEKVMSPTTYEGNYRSPLGTFLSIAARDFGDDGFRLLTTEGIKYTGDRAPEEDQQRALTADELSVMFEGEAFARVAREPNSLPLYWLLVAMLFTGARPRELCQLNPQVDFGEFDGGWYIDLDSRSPAGVGVRKSIKTGEARRIPRHEELLRLGFHEYLKQLKRTGADRLFPSWRVKQGNPFAAHYDLVAGYLREVGLYTRNAPPGEQITGAYVLRKTFVTQCRNQGIVSKEITGHSDGTTTAIQVRHYVFGPEPLLRKLEQLKKLAMPVSPLMPRHQPS